MPNGDRGKRSANAKGLPEPAIALALFVVALAYFHRTLHLTLELRDEGFLFFNIARVAAGEIPHRDFIEVYGPGVYALTAPIFQLFGDRILPVREVLAVFRASGVAFAYLIARHFVPRPFALLGACLAMAYWGWSIWSLNTPYAALFSIPLCMLSLLLLLIGEARGRRAAYAWSGFVCGASLMFKWSLAAVSAYGMVLAICASAMLREPQPAESRSHRVPILIAWLAAGVLIVLPFHSTITAVDYALHLAPIHLLVALVAIHFFRFGHGRSAFARAAPRVARYCAGFVVVPALVALLYLSWGSLGDLFYNTVTRPLNYRNYYSPTGIPRGGSLALLFCIGAFITAALALLRGSRRAMLFFAAVGLVLAPFGSFAVAANGSVWFALELLLVQMPAIIAFAALALIAVSLARPRPLASEPALAVVIAAVFFQEMMAFQIFPRGGYNATLMLATLAPVVAWLAYRWYGVASPDAAPATGPRRAAAMLLVALLPALFVSNKVRFAISAPAARDLGHTALYAPALAGIRPNTEAYERQNLASFDALLRKLERTEPTSAPLFVINNEPMIYFASGRDAIFSDHLLILFLAGWNLLPANDRDTPTAAALIERLEHSSETILVTRKGDRSAAYLLNAFPEVARHISMHYGVSEQVGDYLIIRRNRSR
jgi:hypothetical protein